MCVAYAIISLANCNDKRKTRKGEWINKWKIRKQWAAPTWKFWRTPWILSRQEREMKARVFSQHVTFISLSMTLASSARWVGEEKEVKVIEKEGESGEEESGFSLIYKPGFSPYWLVLLFYHKHSSKPPPIFPHLCPFSSLAPKSSLYITPHQHLPTSSSVLLFSCWKLPYWLNILYIIYYSQLLTLHAGL